MEIIMYKYSYAESFTVTLYPSSQTCTNRMKTIKSVGRELLLPD